MSQLQLKPTPSLAKLKIFKKYQYGTCCTCKQYVWYMKISRADEGALQFQLIKRNRTIVLFCNVLTWNGVVKLISRTAIWTVCSFHYARKLLSMETSKQTKEIKKTENCPKNREKKREERKPAISHTRKITSLKFVFFSSSDMQMSNIIIKKETENKRNRDLRLQYIHNAVIGWQMTNYWSSTQPKLYWCLIFRYIRSTIFFVSHYAYWRFIINT